MSDYMPALHVLKPFHCPWLFNYNHPESEMGIRCCNPLCSRSEILFATLHRRGNCAENP